MSEKPNVYARSAGETDYSLANQAAAERRAMADEITRLTARVEELEAALRVVRPHLVAATCELLLHPPQPQEALDIVEAALAPTPMEKT